MSGWGSEDEDEEDEFIEEDAALRVTIEQATPPPVEHNVSLASTLFFWQLSDVCVVCCAGVGHSPYLCIRPCYVPASWVLFCLMYVMGCLHAFF